MKILLLMTVFFIATQVSAQLKINEVLLKQNGIVFDFEGDCAGIVELINTSNSPISAGTYYLSDDPLNPLKWQFPAIIVLQGQRIIVHLSGKNLTAAELHTSFKISNGEKIILSSATGLIDSSPTNEQFLNVSASRFPDGSGNFVYTTPSIGQTNNNGIAAFPIKPSVNLAPGIYPAGTAITFASNPLTVRYTLNGTEVKANSPTSTTGNIYLSDPNIRPNYYATIPTNPGMNFPISDYDESRANNRGWVEPYGNVNKAFILRTRAYSTTGFSSEEKVYTYFTQLPSYNLPIISIITDSVGYFDNETGIYVFGTDTSGNYNLGGRVTERPATVQFFGADGTFEKEIRFGTRLNGHGSRHAPQKVLRLYNRFEYDTTQFYLPNGVKADVALIRGGGHRPDCIGRDYLATDFVSDLRMDKADPTLYVIYLNGEFWGVQDLRSKLDDSYFADRYGLDKDYVGVADKNYEVSDGYLADPNELKKLTLFAENNDLTIPANYKYLADRIDLDLLMELFCSQIFMGNADFPLTNIGFWKYQDPNGDSKWRHYFYDLDASFGGSCDTVYKSFNTLNYYLQETNGSWTKANRLLRNLILNDDFKNQFINRMADLMNTEFKSSLLLPQFENYKTAIAEIRTDHVNRWRYPSTSNTLLARQSEIPSLTKWNNLYTGFEAFFNDRQRSVRNHFNGKFSIPDSVRITLNVNNDQFGLIQINELYLAKNLSGVNDLQPFPWTGQYFYGINFPVKAISKRGYKFQSWENVNSSTYEALINPSTDTLLNANFVIDPNFIEPMINEVLSVNNHGYQDAFGQHEDWIEIYNKNDYPITLENYFLSDDLTNLTKYRLKSRKESVVPANGYQLFFASEERKRGADHTNFKLSKNETLFLVAPDSVTILDEIDIPNLSADESFGSSPNGATTRMIFANPTPLANNNLSEIVEIEKAQKAFIVYPNPNDGSIVYTSIENDYSIYNMQGSLITTEKNTKILNLRNLQKGAYLVVNKEGSTQLLVIK